MTRKFARFAAWIAISAFAAPQAFSAQTSVDGWEGYKFNMSSSQAASVPGLDEISLGTTEDDSIAHASLAECSRGFAVLLRTLENQYGPFIPPEASKDDPKDTIRVVPLAGGSSKYNSEAYMESTSSIFHSAKARTSFPAPGLQIGMA